MQEDPFRANAPVLLRFPNAEERAALRSAAQRLSTPFFPCEGANGLRLNKARTPTWAAYFAHFRALCEAGFKPAVLRNLLAEFGSKKLSDIPNHQRAAVMAEGTLRANKEQIQ